MITLRHFTCGLAALSLGAMSLLATACGSAQAQDAEASKQKARETIENVARTADRADAFRSRISMSMLTEGPMMPGDGQAQSTSHILTLQRPNKISVRTVATTGFDEMDDVPIIELFSDGRTVTLYSAASKKYLTSEAPDSLADLDEALELPSLMMVLPVPAAEFFVGILFAPQDVEQLIEKHVTAMEYRGIETIDDRECDRLRLTVEDDQMGMAPMGVEFDVWVDRDEKAVWRRLRPDFEAFFKEMLEQMPEMAEMMGEFKLEMTLDWTEWSFEPEIAEDTFAFSPPADAEEVENLMELFGMGDLDFDGEGFERPTHNLLGAAAPDFELVDLDGKSVRLSDHAGKDIVVLDFWATWCPPCVRGLPILDEVTSEFADKNVVFYAVNLRETKQQVENFLKEQDLSLKVLFDSRGEIANEYGVTGIPQTVLIDKKGRIQVIHVGLVGADKVRRELQTLLDGKDLVETPTAPEVEG